MWDGQTPGVSPFHDHAYELTARGLAVLPYGFKQKHPCIKRTCRVVGCRGECGQLGHGVYDATLDMARLIEMMLVLDKRPANVAVATGKKRNLLVLDVDAKHGGEASLAQLQADLALSFDTFTVRSGGGGQHLYFSWPDGTDGMRLASKLQNYPGIDLKGDGGAVTGPWSIHPSGAPYTIERDVPVGPMPACLVALCFSPAPPVVPAAPYTPPDPGSPEWHHANATIQHALSRLLASAGASRKAMHEALYKFGQDCAAEVLAGRLDIEEVVLRGAKAGQILGRPFGEGERAVRWGVNHPRVRTAPVAAPPTYLLTTPAGATVERYDARWCRDLPAHPEVVLLRAPWGTGKSSAIGRAIAADEHVLVVCPRQELASKAAREWGLTDYLEGSGGRLPARAAVCLDSIHRASRAPRGATVVLDEALLHLEHVCGGTLIGKRHATLEHLRAVCAGARRIILADAALDAASAECLRDLLGVRGRTTHWIENHCAAPFNTVTQHASREAAINFALKALDDGCRVAMPATSANCARTVARLASARWPDKTIICLTAEERPEGSINDLAEQADLLVFSPVIGVGESITARFDVVVGVLTSIKNMTADAVLQALFRCRDPGELHLWLDPRGQHSGPTTKHELLRQMQTDSRAARALLGGRLDGVKTDVRDPLFSAWLDTRAWRNGRSQYVKDKVLTSLAARGVGVEVAPAADEDEMRALRLLLRTTKRRVLADEAAEVAAARRLSPAEVAQLSGQYKLNREDRRALQRADISRFYLPPERDDDLDVALVLKDDDKRFRGRVRGYVDVENLILGDKDAVIARDQPAASADLWESGSACRRARVLQAACAAAGLTGPPSAWGGQRVNHDAFQTYVRRHVGEFEGALRLLAREDIEARPAAVFAKVLRLLGLRQIAIERKRHQPRVYAVCTTSVSEMERLCAEDRKRAAERGRALRRQIQQQARRVLPDVVPPPPPPRAPEPRGADPPSMGVAAK